MERTGSPTTTAMALALALFAVALFGDVLPSAQAQAQGPPTHAASNVRVVNGPDLRVPVDARLELGQDGRVPVELAEPVDVAGSVAIVQEAPLVVTEAVHPASTAHKAVSSTQLSSGDRGARAGFQPLPEGKRFVIEHVSIDAGVRPGQTMHVIVQTCEATGPTGCSIGNFDVPLVSQGTFGWLGDVEILVGGGPMRLYSDRVPALQVFRSSEEGRGTVSVDMSGYLVDAPPPADPPIGDD